MGSSIFGIGASALNAAQAGLVTTGHNISNASTPGFSRQEIVQASNTPELTGAGFFGQGVQVSTVKRMYSDFMSSQVTLAQTQSSQLDSYYAEIQQIDNMLGDVSAGLSPALQNFFSGVNGVAANPASIPSRQAMLSGAQELTARFQTLDQRLTEIGTGINGALESSVGVINSYAKQIAALNKDISQAEASTNMQPANDLRDQRDNLVAQLSKEVRATTVKQSDGSYNIFVGNGQPVVIGRQTFDLVAAASAEDPSRLQVGYNSGAATILLGTNTLQGGNLGGLLSFRSETLDTTQNAIGRVAIGLAQKFNDQHNLGQDLNGVLGSINGNFFTVAKPLVVPSKDNAGTTVVGASIVDASALTTSDYTLRFTGQAGSDSNFDLTRLSDGTVTQVSVPTGGDGSLTIDGIDVTISSENSAAGDSWLIRPTRTGARDIAVALKDTAKIAAASPIRTEVGSTNTGGASISAGTVSNVDNLPLAAKITLTYDAAGGTFNTDEAAPRSFAYTSGESIDFGGFSVTITGSPENGDTFAVGPNSGGVSDSSNAAALARLQTTNTLGISTLGGQPLLNFQQAYAQLVSQVGNKTRQTQVLATAQQNLVAQTKQAQQSIAGVNLDDEAANLLRYQQAYQASGKMMQIATSLLQMLLDIGK